MSERTADNSVRTALALFVLALLVRLVWLAVGPDVMESEGTAYTRTAEHLLRGNGFASIHGGPQTMYTLLLPALIAASKLILSDSDVAARMVGVITGAALVLPTFFLGLTLWGRAAAIAAGVLIALNPLLVGYSVGVYTETPYMLFMLCGVYFGLRALEFSGLRHPMLCGLFFGLAYLTRPEGIAFVAIAAVAITVAGLLRKRDLKSIGLAAGVAAVVGAAVASPYVYFLHRHTGEVRLEGKNLINYTIIRRMETGMEYLEAAYGIDDELNEVGPLLVPARYAAYTPYTSGIADIATRVPRQIKTNVADYLQRVLPAFELGSPVLILLLVLAFFRSPWTRTRVAREGFVLACAAYSAFVLSLAHFVLFRYSLPLYAFLMLWAGRGLVEFSEWAQQTVAGFVSATRAQQWLANASTAGAVLLFILFSVTGTRHEPEINSGLGWALPVKEAGLWLRARSPGEKKIMDSWGGMPYYADGHYLPFPYTSPENALRYIEKVNPDYIVLWSEMVHMRPYISEWLERGIPSPSLREIYRKQRDSGGTLVIYERSDRAP